MADYFNFIPQVQHQSSHNHPHHNHSQDEHSVRAAATPQSPKNIVSCTNSNNSVLPAYYDTNRIDSNNNTQSPQHVTIVKPPLISIRKAPTGVDHENAGGPDGEQHQTDSAVEGSIDHTDRDAEFLVGNNNLVEDDFYEKVLVSGSVSSSTAKRKKKTRISSFDLFGRWNMPKRRRERDQPGGLSRTVLRPYLKFK